MVARARSLGPGALINSGDSSTETAGRDVTTTCSCSVLWRFDVDWQTLSYLRCICDVCCVCVWCMCGVGRVGVMGQCWRWYRANARCYHRPCITRRYRALQAGRRKHGTGPSQVCITELRGDITLLRWRG